MDNDVVWQVLEPVSSKYEPKPHPCASNSFADVSYVEMRNNPEVFITELMREVFFDSSTETVKEQQFSPQKYNESLEKQSVIYALRGKRKETKQNRVNDYYAPAYPSLCQYAWIGSKRARVINRTLFRGALAQGLLKPSKICNKEELSQTIVRALRGEHYKESSRNDQKPADIMAVTLFQDDELMFKSYPEGKAIEQVQSMLSKGVNLFDSIDDPISIVVLKDFDRVCQMESTMSRLHWIKILQTYLRFSLPMWVLAKMKTMHILHKWILGALDGNNPPSNKKIEDSLQQRYENLLPTSQIPDREIQVNVETYMRSRIEVNIILYLLDSIDNSILDKKVLSVFKRGSNYITVIELLTSIRKYRNQLISVMDPNENIQDTKKMLMRIGENYGAWCSPLKKGTGKNFDEFFRALRKDQLGDEEGGYLLETKRVGNQIAFVTFPGQLLIKIMTHLAARKCEESSNPSQLTFGHVVEQFKLYGLDFSRSSESIPKLVSELSKLGLLKGSPDAGYSVAVSDPYFTRI